jgi:hypothetical protein
MVTLKMIVIQLMTKSTGNPDPPTTVSKRTRVSKETALTATLGS